LGNWKLNLQGKSWEEGMPKEEFGQPNLKTPKEFKTDSIW